jgi:antitoxin component YwqK of YwqJK toxin-antitoxin module
MRRRGWVVLVLGLSACWETPDRPVAVEHAPVAAAERPDAAWSVACKPPDPSFYSIPTEGEGRTVDGLREGLWTFRLKNPGQAPSLVLMTQTYLHGVLQGPFVAFGADGKPYASGEYRAGKKEGHWTEQPGSDSEEGDYHADVRVGVWIATSSRGEVTKTTYRAGVKHGPSSRTYPGGAPARAGEFDDGKESGTWTEWNPQGRKIEERQYLDGGLRGRTRRWNRAGTLVYECDCVEKKRGSPEGRVRYWDDAGRLITDRTVD